MTIFKSWSLLLIILAVASLYMKNTVPNCERYFFLVMVSTVLNYGGIPNNSIRYYS